MVDWWTQVLSRAKETHQKFPQEVAGKKPKDYVCIETQTEHDIYANFFFVCKITLDAFLLIQAL